MCEVQRLMWLIVYFEMYCSTMLISTYFSNDLYCSLKEFDCTSKIALQTEDHAFTTLLLLFSLFH